MTRILWTALAGAAVLMSTGCGALDALLIGRGDCGPRATCDGGRCGGCLGDGCEPHCPLLGVLRVLDPRHLLYGCLEGCGDCGGCDDACDSSCDDGHASAHYASGAYAGGGVPPGRAVCGSGPCRSCCGGILGLGIFPDWECGLWGWGCGERYWGDWYSEPTANCEPCDCHGNFTGPARGSYFAHRKNCCGGSVEHVSGEYYQEPAIVEPVPQSPSTNPYSPPPAPGKSAAKRRSTRTAQVPQTYRAANYTRGFQPRHEAVEYDRR